MPVTYFTKKQCDNIQRGVYPTLLPKMGYYQHTPNVVRFGPIKDGGAGLINVQTEQIVKHVQFFVGTLRQPTELAQMLQCTLPSYQLLLRTQELFLNQSRKRFPYQLPDNSGCIPYLWKISNICGISYNIDGLFTSPITRVRDRQIMDAMTKKDLPNQMLIIANSYRVWLKGSSIADVITPDGKEI